MFMLKDGGVNMIESAIGDLVKIYEKDDSIAKVHSLFYQSS